MRTKEPAGALLAGLLVAGVGAQEPTRKAQTPTFPTDVEVVVVDVVVTEKEGGPSGGLRSEDFKLTEDGVPQQIATFEAVDVSAAAPQDEAAAPEPAVSMNTGAQAMSTRSFVLVFDQVHLTHVGAQRARVAIAQFLRFGPREGDTVMLVGTGGGAWWMTRATGDTREIEAVLQRLQGLNKNPDTPERITEWEAMRIWEDRDPIVLEQVRRRFETYVTGQARRAEGLPVRATDRLAEEKEFVSDTEIQNRAQEAYQQSLVRNRTTLAALSRVLDSLGAVRGRKTVILLSEGFIHDTRLDEFNGAIRAAQRSNVAIYFVDVRGMSAMPLSATAQFGPFLPAADVADEITQDLVSAAGADTLAGNTGGFTIKNTNDLERGLRRIAQENRRYYLLGYSPTNTKRDGSWRKIAVQVDRPGVEVRARKGYFAPGGTRRTADRDARAWRPGLQQALDSPYEFANIPLRMIHHVLGEASPGKARTLFTTAVDVRGLAFQTDGDVSLDILDYLLVVTNRDSGEFQRQDRKLELKLPSEARATLERAWLPISHEFDLVPGVYRAKVVVRDTRGDKIGSVSRELDVPDPRGFWVSSPVLSDALEPRKEGAALRPVIGARRAFAPGATLYFQFEVYGSARDSSSGLPRVSSGFTLRSREGAVVAQGAPAPIRPTPEGRIARIGALPLKDIASGDYELLIDLKDEVAGRALELREAFVVRPGAGS